MAAITQKTQNRIFATGDIHGEMGITRLSSEHFPQGNDLAKDDYLLILGDFGLIWAPEQTKEEQYWLQWLSKKPWTTLFLDGNHENFDRLLAYPPKPFMGGEASHVHDSVYHLRRGHVFNIGSLEIFVMGGADSVDKAIRVDHEKKTGLKTWWPQEIPSERDVNTAWHRLAAHNYRVDCILTHTLPTQTIHSVPDIEQPSYAYATSNILAHMLKKVRFKRWYAGHFHREFTSGPFTLLYQDIIELPVAQIQEEHYTRAKQ